MFYADSRVIVAVEGNFFFQMRMKVCSEIKGADK